MTDGSANTPPSSNAENDIRGLKAGLLIALLGPPLGVLILEIQFVGEAIIERNYVTVWVVIEDAIRTLLPAILYSYIFVGIPALVVALYAGIRIGTRGWLSLLEFLILSVFLSLAMAALLRGVQGLISASSLRLLPQTLITAFILRYLMLRCGIMKRPSNR